MLFAAFALDKFLPNDLRNKYTMSGPLNNIRVLDMSRILAGPWASQTLADLGAEVIKIEKPGGGDDTRGWGPPFITEPNGDPGDAAYFLSVNRGKHSVAVDMATSQGQALIKQLAAKCDIVIENFKVGGLKKYQLDYDSLKVSNPGLIYCSITGFGQNGPLASRAGYDFMIQGMGGIMSVTGQPDGTPGAGPMKSGMATADIFTGLYSTVGILAALHHREHTGEGQHIDMALLDTQIAVLGNQALNYLVGGKIPQRLGNAHPNIVPYQTFDTKDGHIIIAIGNDRQFRAFCERAEAPHLADDERYLTNRDRVNNRDRLIRELTSAVRKKTTQEWIRTLEDAAVPCGPINTIDQVFDDDQVRARRLELQLERQNGVKTPSVANPIRLSETPIEYSRPAPALGADTGEVLKTLLNLSDTEIAALKKSGCIQ